MEEELKKRGTGKVNNNLSFITNEGEANLINHFATPIKDTRYFDCLVGYFCTLQKRSGYRKI